MKLSVRFLVLLALFLPVLIGCASNAGRAVGEHGPTADTGPVPTESTTGGDAAGTLNLPTDARGSHGEAAGGGH
jgi:hypothetical protein